MIYCSPCKVNMDRKIETLDQRLCYVTTMGIYACLGLFIVACFLFFSPYPFLKNKKYQPQIWSWRNLLRQGWWSETLIPEYAWISLHFSNIETQDSRLPCRYHVSAQRVRQRRRWWLAPREAPCPGRLWGLWHRKQDATETTTKQL